MRRSNGTTLHGQTPGFLGKQHASFAVDQNLLADDVQIKALHSPDDLTTITLAATYADRYDDTSIANFALNGNSVARQGRPTLTYETCCYRSSQDPGFSPRLSTEQKGASLTVVRDFPAFTLTSISGYRKTACPMMRTSI